MTTPPLSPAARAVLDAVTMHQFGVIAAFSRRESARSGAIAAAALRAAALHAAESHNLIPIVRVDDLLAIADELEAGR